MLFIFCPLLSAVVPAASRAPNVVASAPAPAPAPAAKPPTEAPVAGSKEEETQTQLSGRGGICLSFACLFYLEVGWWVHYFSHAYNSLSLPDGRNALLEAIRNPGMRLRKVQTELDDAAATAKKPSAAAAGDADARAQVST